MRSVSSAPYRAAMTAASERSGPFWEAIEGRAPLPPVAMLLGWTLEQVDPDAGTIVVRFDARPEFTNPVGHIQGGILASMLDDTMGPALVATLPPGQFAPTRPTSPLPRSGRSGDAAAWFTRAGPTRSSKPILSTSTAS